MKKLLLLLVLLMSISGTFIGCKSNSQSVILDTNRLRIVDNIINRSIEQGETPGAVLAVVNNNQIAYLKAYGNRQTYPTVEPMTVNTVFDLASVTKPISTAIAAMILVDRGELRLQDNVSLFIPDFKDWTDSITNKKQSVKVLDLLVHTSGLPAYASVAELQKMYTMPNPEGLLSHISDKSGSSEPGKSFRYSCLNYIALQYIIEKISGQSLDEFTKHAIYQPLGMKNTGYNPTGDMLKNIASTARMPDSTVLAGRVHDQLARVVNDGISGNAGLFSTADDLCVLASMLMNDGKYKDKRILSPLALKAMISVPVGYESFGRSLGWDVTSPYSSNKGDLFGSGTYGHTGYTGTSIIIDPDLKIAVILLTNRVHPVDKSSVTRLRSLVANVVAGAVVMP